MRAIERKTRADLRSLPDSLRDSGPAQVLVDLARRLDDGPDGQTAVLLARELRIGMKELREQAKGGVGDQAEQYLQAVANPAFGHTTH